MTTARIRLQTNQFRNDNILSLILRYSIPSTISSFMLAAYNVVDRIFIGRVLGPEAIAGIGITFQLFMVAIALGLMVGIGGATLTSLRLGERKFGDAERILGSMFFLFIFGGLLIAVGGTYFLKPIIYLFGGSDVTYPYASEYLAILLWFMPFDFMSMGTNSIIQASGNPRFSMWNIAFGCVMNIILDYIFIFIFDMGIAGAAWATGISKVLSTVLIFWHFRFRRVRSLTLRIRNIRFDWSLIYPMICIGISPFILQGAIAVMNAVLNNTLYRYGGDEAIAIVTINFTVLMLMAIPIFGVLMGYQPIAAYNYGAQLYRRAAKTLSTAVLVGLIVTLILYIPIQIFAEEIVGLLCNHNATLMAHGGNPLRIFVLGMPLAVIFVLSANFFQTTGRPKLTIIFNLFRQLFCFVSLIMILSYFFGLSGIWWAMPAADVISTIVALYFIIPEFRRLYYLSAERKDVPPLELQEALK